MRVRKYFKQKEDENKICESTCPQNPAIWDEIDEDAFKVLMDRRNKRLEKERIGLGGATPQLIPYDGKVLDSVDFGKLYNVQGLSMLSKLNVVNVEADYKGSPSQTRVKMDHMKEMIGDGVEFPPSEIWYCDIIDKYFIFDGKTRAMSYYELSLPIRYVEPEINIDKLRVVTKVIEDYREDMELVNFGELETAEIGEDKYIELLKLRNNWRKDLI